MNTAIRSTAEVQTDIDSLIRNIDVVSDQIFKIEQESTDYRAILKNPQSANDNPVKLAVMREHRRALEIALEAARQDLQGAELNELREHTLQRREALKAVLAERETAAVAAHNLISAAVEAVLTVRRFDVGLIQHANVKAENHLTEQGYLVLDGMRVLNDPELLGDWAVKTLEKGLESGGKFTWDFTGAVANVGRNILREWDIANSANKLKIIDHDPIHGPEGTTPPAPVEQFDPDPTEEDLASIADLPPEKAAKAMNAFANSRWGRANGLSQSPATPEAV